ncbi:hypothetical protein BCR44DRAFT_51938 [Catenaria anguillulae PL171]|nr:hypothetical protein BCR44DRAFT_51938 [Catenaria anguillulae PL171]
MGNGESSAHLDGLPRLASQGPSFPTFIYRLAVLVVGVTALVSLVRPRTHHRSPSLPTLTDPLSSTSSDLPIIVATLQVDPSLPTPTVAQHKSARPFAINATIMDSDADGREQWSAPIAPLSTWPRRKWDPASNATASSSPLDLSHLQFGVSGNAKAFDRIALASQTWGRNPNVQWTVFWTEADDPNGMHGDHSYLLDGFKALTGRYPVVMRGDPAHPDRTMNRKWFKMLSFLYERSPKETKWFVMGDDDTVWFPRVLLASLQALPVDPLKESLYLGDLSEAHKAVKTFGKTMAFGGGGAVISRALAQRIHLRHRWCLDELPDHHGDGLLRTCIEKVTAMDGQGNVTLTRMPIFNQIDLKPWLNDGRLYLTSRLSRAAPASLHHPDSLPSLMADSPNKLLALYNLWHILANVPVELMFRRFFIHIESRGTAVVTFGLHVRIYMRRLASLDHAVDYDSNITRDKEFLGVEYLLEEKLEKPDDKASWPKKREEYQDFWISEFDPQSNRMVFMDKKNKMSMALTCKGPGSSLLTMCTEEEGEE